MGPPKRDLDARLRAVKGLTKIYRLERFAYLGATGLSFAVLIVLAIKMLVRGETSLGQWALMFGSTGLITVTASGLLKMWNQAIRFVASEPVDGAKEGGDND